MTEMILGGRTVQVRGYSKAGFGSWVTIGPEMTAHSYEANADTGTTCSCQDWVFFSDSKFWKYWERVLRIRKGSGKPAVPRLLAIQPFQKFDIDVSPAKLAKELCFSFTRAGLPVGEVYDLAQDWLLRLGVTSAFRYEVLQRVLSFSKMPNWNIGSEEYWERRERNIPCFNAGSISGRIAVLVTGGVEKVKDIKQILVSRGVTKEQVDDGIRVLKRNGVVTSASYGILQIVKQCDITHVEDLIIPRFLLVSKEEECKVNKSKANKLLLDLLLCASAEEEKLAQSYREAKQFNKSILEQARMLAGQHYPVSRCAKLVNSIRHLMWNHPPEDPEAATLDKICPSIRILLRKLKKAGVLKKQWKESQAKHADARAAFDSWYLLQGDEAVFYSSGVCPQ